MKTAVATTAERCEFQEQYGRCEKAATKLLVWEIAYAEEGRSSRLAERQFCTEHFATMIALCKNWAQDFEWEKLV